MDLDPGRGPIRLSTLTTAVVLVVLAMWRRGDTTVAVFAVMAWVASYEIAYQPTGTLLRGWSVGGLFWVTLALSGWVAAAALRGVVPDKWLLLVTGVVWLFWIATGFNSNSATSSNRFSWTAESFNELTKTVPALAFLVGALRAKLPATQ